MKNGGALLSRQKNAATRDPGDGMKPMMNGSGKESVG